MDLIPPADGLSIRALDVGCGDMTLAETIAIAHPNIDWTCSDIHEVPAHLAETEKWKKYQRFDGTRLPFKDRAFDVVLFSDVLHHCLPQAPALLREAARAGRFVIVKDHFELGWFSRSLLRLLDFVGNYGYGVSIPDHYFRPETFSGIARQAGLRVVSMDDQVSIYPGFLALVFPSTLHFLVVLEASSS